MDQTLNFNEHLPFSLSNFDMFILNKVPKQYFCTYVVFLLGGSYHFTINLN